MAAQQFLVPGNHATVRGLVAPNATASLYTSGTLTPQPFYSDAGLSVSLGSTITADAIGVFPIAYQDNAIGFRIIFKDATGATLDGGDIDPFVFGQTITTVTGSASAATRSALAALAGSSSSGGIYLKESGREGTFVWSAANLSANVTADTQQGIYVAPASDTTGASGAWVRKYNGPMNITWFGAVADGTTTNDLTAIQAAFNMGGAILIPWTPVGNFYFYANGLLEWNNQVEVVGQGFSFDARQANYESMAGSRIKFGTNGGIKAWTQARIDDTNTVVANTPLYFVQQGATNSSITDVALIGPGGAPDTTAHAAIETRAKITVARNLITGFAGVGVDVNASADVTTAGSDYGNASGFVIDDNQILGNGLDGIRVRGRDANIGQITSNKIRLNGRWGGDDQSTYGCQWDNNQFATNNANYANANSAVKASATSTIGSLRIYTLVGSCAPKDNYVESGQGQGCDIPSVHFIDGGLLSGTTNQNADPASAQNGVFSKLNYVKIIGNHVAPGADTTQGHVFRTNNEGVVLQGAGASFDFQFNNHAGNRWLTLLAGTLNPTLYGNLTYGGADPTITANGTGSDAVGAQLLMGYGGTQKLQVYQSSGTTYVSADAITVRDNTARTDPRIDINSTGLNLYTGKALSYNGTAVLSSGILTAAAFPALTGNVTTSAGSLATTIAAGVVTLAMQANMATASVVYRKTAGSGAPEVQTLATLKTDLGLTGTNSGDQTITLTGNVTGSGTGSFATTIAAGVVTRAMMANTAAATVLGSTAAGAVAELTAAQGRTVLGLATVASSGLASDLTGTLAAAQMPALTGDVTTSSGAVATTLATNIVTYAKFQQVAASSLVGNATGSLANAAGITLAGGLAFSGTTLTAAGALTPTSVASTGAVTSSSATAGSGYATGAGGAVTQLTSRTTGVTLSKPCGAITLFSAAGSATWATFIVTNTLVAATDTIEICQKSGANLYNVIVTAVGAGSFNVSVSAVSGTATESPVFNFVVTKAVAA